MTAVALREALTLADVLAGTGGTLATRVAGEVAFTGVSIDSRATYPGVLFVAVKGPRFDGHDFLAEVAGRGARAALVHRDAAAPAGLPLVRVADTTKGLADLARHVRREAALPVVGVTGSVGKTTTKDMTAHLLATRGPVLKTEGNLNNQYGLPLTLLRLAPEHTAAVLEMGMSAPGRSARSRRWPSPTWPRSRASLPSTWSSSPPWTRSPTLRPRSSRACGRVARRSSTATTRACARSESGSPAAWCGSGAIGASRSRPRTSE